jgi:organic radical activating enzyme
MEAFYTLQGEGVYAGHAAWFIRLGGCDVGCVWCDVKDSWEVGKHPLVSVEELIAEALNSPSRLAVITGGEPAMYNLVSLTYALKKAGFRTHLETSGAYPLSGSFDWVTFSPKKFKAPLPSVASVANELKIIVFNKSDFEWAEKHAKTVKPHCRLLLQPEWDKQNQMLPLIIDYIKQHPRWEMSLQTHKFMGIP